MARSGGHCEAIVEVFVSETTSGPGARSVWTRCFDAPIEVHHRLTRARGGLILDELGEIYHLIALCPRHHRGADGKPAYEYGLLLDGMMVRNGDTHYYTGSDAYLSRRYPA